MKCAFFFDTILLKDNNNDYYAMTLTYDFLKKRYLDIFDKLIVSTRVKEKQIEKGNTNGYKKTNGNNINVKPIKAYRNVIDAIIRRKKIKKEIKEIIDNVDLLIIRMPSVIGMFACQYANKIRKKYIVEMVACPWDGYMNHVKFGGKILAPIITILTKKYIKKSPKVLYVTKEFLQKRYPSNGKSYYCSDVDLKENDNKKVLEKRLYKTENKGIIKLCTVASVELKYKGQEYVIKALKQLNKDKIKYEYYLAGGGDSIRLKRIAIKYGVYNQVHFLGSLTHEAVFELLDDIDIYIQPSLQEGLPRALIEAMSRACVCLGSNAGGIPELINKEQIFRKKNVKDIISILKGLSNKDIREIMKENYDKSLKFENNILNEKRKNIYKNI